MEKKFSKKQFGKPAHKGNFKPRFEKFEPSFNDVDMKNLSDINPSLKGDQYAVSGVVDRVILTGGPTVFYISDGSGTLALKAFVGAGVRANPEVEVGDYVKSIVTIEEYNEELEGSVDKMVKLTDSEKSDFAERIRKMEIERAKVIPPAFLYEDQILVKLKDSFVKAATEIRLAIIQNRPIIIRHHNDTDGYSSGYSMERAILPLVVKQHNSVKAAWEFYTRAPCNAPLYEIDDSIRDTAHSLANAAKFSNKMPLIVIVDTGSGKEDLLGIQQGRVHGIDFIVVDHHIFEEDVISKEVKVHINPFLVGEDGAKYSAGMLCTELARFINPVDNIIQIPAMAGLADRINNPKAVEAYLKIASTKGYDKNLLMDIATVIDFVSSKLRFMEAREYIEVLFGEPMEKQKALVGLLAPYIRNLEKKGLAIAKSGAKVEKIGDLNLQLLDIETTFPRFGFYPKPGKCTGLLHDSLVESGNEKVVTMGVMAEAITMRATDKADFSVQGLIAHLTEKLPSAFVQGGGHKNAGSINFLPSKKAEVLELVRSFVKKK